AQSIVLTAPLPVIKRDNLRIIGNGTRLQASAAAAALSAEGSNRLSLERLTLVGGVAARNIRSLEMRGVVIGATKPPAATFEGSAGCRGCPSSIPACHRYGLSTVILPAASASARIATRRSSS